MSVNLYTIVAPSAIKGKPDLLDRFNDADKFGYSAIVSDMHHRVVITAVLHTDLQEGDEDTIENFYRALGALEALFPETKITSEYLGLCTDDIDEDFFGSIGFSYEDNVLKNIG